MFIQTEATPNPLTIKFIPGQTVLASGNADFPTSQSANGRSPLSERLFRIEGVAGVFIGSDYVSITKNEMREWLVIKPLILGALFEHFSTGQPVLNAMSEEVVSRPEDNEVVMQIKELLDTQIRPSVARDGGDITFDSYDKGIVYLRLRGACSGCPSSMVTLKSGIESMLHHYLPEVLEVRAVED